MQRAGRARAAPSLDEAHGSRRLPARLRTALAGAALLLGAAACPARAGSADADPQLAAAARVHALQRVLQALRGADIKQRLEGVNRFFNGLDHRSDHELWGRPDYWAAPREFLAVGAGDCEDFAIGKYFALRALGVRDEELTLVYAFDRSREVPHVVLVHGPPGSADARVLDNTDPVIRRAWERPELEALYAVNATAVRVAVAPQAGQLRFRAVARRHAEWERMMSARAGVAGSGDASRRSGVGALADVAAAPPGLRQQAPSALAPAPGAPRPPPAGDPALAVRNLPHP